MAKNIRTQVNKVIGKSLNAYHEIMKPVVDDLKFKEQYQGRIVDCMVGEIDDNYIETPETDSPIVKLEYSKEGVVKIPTIKGKTILVDSDGNATDTPGEGCRLVSVGEEESNKMIILSKNKNLCTPFKKGAIIATTGEISFSEANVKISVITDFIPIDSNKNYYLQGVEKNSIRDAWYFIAMYDNDKKYIKRTGAI
ncbi:MAG: hypothetical protein J6D12_02165, partial [Peptostreptococcaceae bacterium]|nr:hypothetical protein [Peptostreptococcaceae bacterium]